jgi:hypothetical protein
LIVSKPKVATPWIVALVITTFDYGLSPTLLFAADEPATDAGCGAAGGR